MFGTMPLKFRLQDLPERLRTQAERQLAPKKAAASAQPPKPTPTNPLPPIDDLPLAPYSPKSSRPVPVRNARDIKMSATERRYLSQILGNAARFEPITLVLASGSRYTPDFLTIDDGVPTLHEVKGSYRLASQGRALTAFREAAAQFPFFRFVWAFERKGGGFGRSVLQPIPLHPSAETPSKE